MAARPGSEVMARFAPFLAEATAGGRRDSLRAVIVVLVLIWNDELGQAQAVSDALLADARARGSMNMIANLYCLRSMILRRLGRLHAAADDGRMGFDFTLRTSPLKRPRLRRVDAGIRVGSKRSEGENFSSPFVVHAQSSNMSSSRVILRSARAN